MIRIASLAALAMLAGATDAQDAPRLGLPADCALGDTCFIQQYPDADPSPAAQDYMCGALSYDGHKGTDFGLPSLAAMEAGVDVFASAPGTVRGMRDGMPDRIFSADMESEMAGRDCGNGVAIDHGNGWETQYCHMAEGSLMVRTGDVVERGTPLGRIGLSGRTQFPHVHISLRKDGETVDPFRPEAGCGAVGADPLWIDLPAYQPGGLLAAGLSVTVPDYDAIKAGTAAIEALATDAPSLVAWGYGYGARKGDTMQLTIIGPNGETVFQQEAAIDKAQAQYFRAAGKRARTPWPEGSYTARAELLRDGTVIDTAEGTAQTGPISR
ncbi:M23 family metallopeptidase [Roseovarius sp. S4756]|uniref:M23 family metallopeptidase n=1 Tax=Roseovarius maritimus TaxID=3342637 RepID=UPI0037290A72